MLSSILSPSSWTATISSGMNSFHSLVIVIIYFQVATALNLHSFSYLDEIQQKDAYLTLTIATGIMVQMKAIWFWKNSTNMEAPCQPPIRNEHTDQQNSNNNPKFEIGQLVMLKNHAHHTFKPKYLLNSGVLKILNNSTLLLVTPNGKGKQILMMLYLVVYQN